MLGGHVPSVLLKTETLAVWRVHGSLVVLVTLSLGCSTGSSDKCFVGDASRPVELKVVHRDENAMIVETAPGARVPLIQPPQGGKVLFIGARARNLDGCPAHVRASLYDPSTNAVAFQEARDVILKATSDGWLEPDLPNEVDNYANIAVCPPPNPARNVDGERYRLELEISDDKARTQATTLDIIPYCGEAAIVDRCHCECGPHPTSCTPSDGGS
jgi:hypothetical protein